MDLAAIGRGGEKIVTALPWGLLWYPQSLEIPLAIGVLVLAAVLVWVLRRRGALTLPRVALSVSRFGRCARGGRRRRLRGVASGAADRPCTGFGRGRGAVPTVLYRLAMLLAGLARPLVVRAGTSTARCRWPRRRHARRARPRRRAARVHPARPLRGRRAAGAGRDGRCCHCGAASRASYGRRTGVYLLALAVAAILLGPAIWIGFDIGLGTGPLSAVLLAMFVHTGASADRGSPGHYLPARCRDGKCALRRFRRCS